MRRSRHCKLLSREINFQRAPFSVARKFFEREGTFAKNNLFLEHPRGRSRVCSLETRRGKKHKRGIPRNKLGIARGIKRKMLCIKVRRRLPQSAF